MSVEYHNDSNQNPKNDEVDLIRLLNYFKNGIKSFFKFIWRIVELFILFIILLKRNWIIVISLIIAGGLFGYYISYSQNSVRKYEMVVLANPTSNMEMYSLADEIDKHPEVATSMINIEVDKMKIESIERPEDVISSYFKQIETTSFRSEQTDTLIYKNYELSDFSSKMDKFDFTFQRITFSTNLGSNPKIIQSKFLDYINNLSGVKRDQESRLNSLVSYEKTLNRLLTNIDSLLISRAIANRNSSPSMNEQVLVNTASRGNVEADLLRYSEIFSRKLFGTQKLIAENQKGVQIVSQLKLTSDNSGLNNPIIKYSLIGFILSCLVVLLIQFNNYLNKYSAKRGL